MIRNRATTIAAALALAIGSASLVACGDDKETTSSSTTSEPAEVTETPDSGSFSEATSALEAAGFTVEPKPESELTQSAGLSKPITATAGALVTKDG